MNGIPILNLRHLCHVLDKFTVPHVKEDTPTTDTATEGSELHTKKEGVSCGNSDIATNDQSSIVAMGVSSAVTLTEREEDSYTSFNMKESSDFEGESSGGDGDGGGSTGTPSNRLANDTTSELDNLSPEDLLYSEFTDQMDNLYHGAGDDPLLLDCTNFIHFELDKDKVVVFDIASAYVKNTEILQQYAITLPRSPNLPEQKY